MRLLALPSLLLLAACSMGSDLNKTPPPLRDMEEPLELKTEPDDESARGSLDLGSFSGLVVADARDTLAAKLDEPSQLRVSQVVENSPAMAAGLQVDDILLEAAVGDAKLQPLAHTSEWRKIELDQRPGTKVTVLVDRAGREVKTSLSLTARVRTPARIAAETFREEARVGLVFRTATEVEARAASLGPGGGAVVIGLSKSSPWRSAGIRFGDVLATVDDRPLSHPQDLLTALRDPDRQRVRLSVFRDGKPIAIDAPLSSRASALEEISIPLIYSYERNRGSTEWSAILGLLKYRSTAAAWRFRLLWLISFGGGDEDRLIEGGS